MIGKSLGVSNFEDDVLLDEAIRHNIIEDYRKRYLEKKKEDGYTILLKGCYFQSIFQDFESYLRLNRVSEDDIELILKEYNSKFVAHEKFLGAYSNRIVSDTRRSFGYQIKDDDFSLKTNLLTGKNLRSDNTSSFNFVLEFSPFWDYKNFNEHIIEKCIDLSPLDKINSKADCIDGSVLNGIKKQILYSFVSNKPGCKIFCSLEAIYLKKIIKSALDIITFCLKDNKNEDIFFKWWKNNVYIAISENMILFLLNEFSKI